VCARFGRSSREFVRRSVGAADCSCLRGETEAIISENISPGRSGPPGEFSRALFGAASAAWPRGRAIERNRYGSTLEILSHVQIWYVEKETRDLGAHPAGPNCSSPFTKAQSDYGPQHRARGDQ